MFKKYDLIAIGDCTIDAFIRLHDASVLCDINNANCQICLSFADKIPYETLTIVPAVGNSSNVAVGSARLGLKSAILTAVGDDYYGRQILGVYKKEGVSDKLVRINKGRLTNYHFVLNFKAERTILVKQNEFEYFDPEKIDDVGWIYFSSMGSNTLTFHERLVEHLGRHPKVKLAFNPGTFQLKLGKEKLKTIYERTYLLFVNREEGAKILGLTSLEIKPIFTGLHALGPKIVVITDGPAGAYASDGSKSYFMPSYPDPKPPFERTGAGDAFSTGFITALIYGLPITEALRWAPVNSMNVVQYTGAQEGLLTRQKLEELLKAAPPSYIPREI